MTAVAIAIGEELLAGGTEAGDKGIEFPDVKYGNEYTSNGSDDGSNSKEKQPVR